MGAKICSSFTLRPEEHQADRRNGSNLQTVTYLPPSKKTDLYPVLQCFYFAILSSRTKLDTVFDVFLNLQEMLLNMYYVLCRREICQKLYPRVLTLCQKKKRKPYKYAPLQGVYKPYLHGFKYEMFVCGILRG